MAKPRNSERTDTTISLPKTVKGNLRLYAKPIEGTNRNESDAQVLTRILKEYMQTHEPINTVPIPTYKPKTS